MVLKFGSSPERSVLNVFVGCFTIFGKLPKWVCTVWCLCNTVNLLLNPHKRHTIAHPWGWGVFCEFNLWLSCVPFAAVYNATWYWTIPDNKVHGANMGPTWVLSAPDGPHVGPMNLAIRDVVVALDCIRLYIHWYIHVAYMVMHMQYDLCLKLDDGSASLMLRHHLISNTNYTMRFVVPTHRNKIT